MSDGTAGATICYNVDGSTPTTSSQIYVAPFLVASNLGVRAMAAAPGLAASAVASESFAFNIASGTLVWSDEFVNSNGANTAPNSKVWDYDTGNNGYCNHELECYSAWGSTTAPCTAANPNAFVGTSMISTSQGKREISLRSGTPEALDGEVALEEVAQELHANKRTLILCGTREQPGQLMHQAEFEEVVGAENICENVQAALRRAEEVFEHLPPPTIKSTTFGTSTR